MIRLYCFKDAFNWGERLAVEIRNNSGEANVFTHPKAVPDQLDTAAFIKPTHFPLEEVEQIQALHDEFEKFDQTIRIPSYFEHRINNNKLLQYKKFGTWMLPALVTEDHIKALAAIDAVEYPVFSKSSAGNGATGIRILDAKPAAFAEVQAAFSEEGVRTLPAHNQKDYIIFQNIIKNKPAFTHRILLFAKRYAVIVRHHANEETGLTNGIGKIEMIDVMEPHLHNLLQWCTSFVDEFDLRFAIMNVLCEIQKDDDVHKPHLVSVSANWPMEWFDSGGLIFRRKVDNRWESTGEPASRFFHFLANAILNGSYDVKAL